MSFPRFFMKFSAMPFAHGAYGIFFLCSKPIYFAYNLNSSLLYGGPLSLAISSGIPNVERILSIAGMTAVPEVERKISTIGNLEYRHCTTSKYSPVSNGPYRSVASFDQPSKAHGPLIIDYPPALANAQ